MRIAIIGKLGAGQIEFIEKLVPALGKSLGHQYHVCTMPAFTELWNAKQYDFSDKSKMFDFQMEIFKARLEHERNMKTLEQQFPNTVFVLNGSIIESRYAVWGAMRECGLLTDKECTALYKAADNNFGAVDFMVELFATNQQCINQILVWSENNEKHVPKKYLSKLQAKLDNVIEDHGKIQSHICYQSNSLFANATYSGAIIPAKVIESITESVHKFYKRQVKL